MEDGLIEQIHAELVTELDAPALSFRVVNYRHWCMPGHTLTAPPLDEIMVFANRPFNAIELIKQDKPPEVNWPKRLALANRSGRKPDHFYGMVLILRRNCERNGLPYAETIANENGVTPNVVFRWVAEAKRREITIDDGGQVRIKGKPMAFATEGAEPAVQSGADEVPRLHEPFPDPFNCLEPQRRVAL